MELKTGQEVKYIGPQHSILEKDKTYIIHEVFEQGIRVITTTGFAGIPENNFKVIDD